MKRNVLILGATSGIARGIAEALARRGDQLILAARKTDEAERIAADLKVRFEASVTVLFFDAADLESHADFVAGIENLDGVVLAFGFMADQREVETSLGLMKQTVELNYLAAMTVLEPIAARFAAQKRGFIAALSSVAGDRGRQSNYIYGSAKAALSTYLAGLRNRLAPDGVEVLTVKPGFVYTAMTHGLVNPDSPLVALPEKVGEDVAKALEKQRANLYTPWFWRWIMLIIRSIPEFVFKKLKL